MAILKDKKKMDEEEKNFTKNINLDEYRNSDGTFNVYKAKRSLKGGKGADKIIKNIIMKVLLLEMTKKNFLLIMELEKKI